MIAEREPLVFVTPIEKVLSKGFIQHDLKGISSLYVVRPGVDPVKDLESLLELFREPLMQQVVTEVANQHRSMN